jgi:hypothetical protein
MRNSANVIHMQLGVLPSCRSEFSLLPACGLRVLPSDPDKPCVYTLTFSKAVTSGQKTRARELISAASPVVSIFKRRGCG